MNPYIEIADRYGESKRKYHRFPNFLILTFANYHIVRTSMDRLLHVFYSLHRQSRYSNPTDAESLLFANSQSNYIKGRNCAT